MYEKKDNFESKEWQDYENFSVGCLHFWRFFGEQLMSPTDQPSCSSSFSSCKPSIRDHFFGQRANSIKGKRLIDNFYPSTRLRHESTIPDSRLKPSSKPIQACIMSSSSDNELPLSAAEPRTPEKQSTPPPLLHPSVVEARARPREMMELRPSISSSQMPRGICSWTI